MVTPLAMRLRWAWLCDGGNGQVTAGGLPLNGFVFEVQRALSLHSW